MSSLPHDGLLTWEVIFVNNDVYGIRITVNP